MATKRKFTVFYRRKREGRTNYKKRLALLLSKKPRLIVRPSTNNMITQVIGYAEEGDRIKVAAKSTELRKLGWKYNCGNLPSAYLTGFLIGKKAGKKGIKDAILDLGLNPSVKHSRIYGVVKGAIDAGLKVPCSEETFPDENRLKGKHIAEYSPKQDVQFSRLKKNNVDPKNIIKVFEEVKKKIGNQNG